MIATTTKTKTISKQQLQQQQHCQRQATRVETLTQQQQQQHQQPNYTTNNNPDQVQVYIIARSQFLSHFCNLPVLLGLARGVPCLGVRIYKRFSDWTSTIFSDTLKERIEYRGSENYII